MPPRPPKRAAATPPRGVVWACLVRQRRESLGLSMRALARRCGVALASVSNAEAGLGVSLRVAYRIARFMQASVHELWFEPGHGPAPRPPGPGGLP